MNTESDTTEQTKPLAGQCRHRWIDQESPYLISQVCEHCKLYRYKAALISDWEYRAPIPRAALQFDWS